MSDRPHTVVRDRIQVFDGLRGIAILLVMLSHTSWLTWPHVRGEGDPVTRALLENGNFAVSIFFVIGAFLYTRSLLNRAASPQGLHPGVQVIPWDMRWGGRVGSALVHNTPTTSATLSHERPTLRT